MTARAEVLSRLVIAAGNARSNGNTKEAAALVQRALSIDPADPRVRALRLDVERDMRGAADVATARELLGKGLRERAMQVIEMGLKDDPRNDALRQLQRKVELESRRAELVKPKLAETRPVSLDFRDANVRMVLDVLTRNSGINFLLDKDVRPDARASVYMQQVRVEDAIELITSTNHLAYKAVVVNKDVASSHAAFFNSSCGFLSGFSQTSSSNSQSRVVPVQRPGWRFFAAS